MDIYKRFTIDFIHATLMDRSENVLAVCDIEVKPRNYITIDYTATVIIDCDFVVQELNFVGYIEGAELVVHDITVGKTYKKEN